MRVPDEAAGGYAKLTLTIEGMEPGEMIPATIEALVLGDDDDLPAVREAAKEAVPMLVTALQSNRWDPENAAEALGYFGPAAKDAVPALTAQLPAYQSSMGYAAAEALTRILPADEFVRKFAPLLLAGNPKQATAVAKALESLGPTAKAAAPELIRSLTVEPVYDSSGLNDEYRYLRRSAAHALAQIGVDSDEVVAALIKLLSHENGAVRRQAALALEDRAADAKAAVPALIKILTNEDPHAMPAAVRALGKIGPAAAEAAPHLKKLVKEESKGEYILKVSHLSENALKRITDDEDE